MKKIQVSPLQNWPPIGIRQKVHYHKRSAGYLIKDLLQKKKKEGNAKNVLLYATEIGVKLSKAHKLYDTIDIAKTMGELKKECSPEEIDNFYKVISVYNKVIQNDFEINRGKKNNVRSSEESI
nr:hypothetical protein [Lacrimispora celerecrescens]